MTIIIRPNKKAGLAKVGASDLQLDKALAAIEQIESDIEAIQTDIAALPAADNAATKVILGRTMQGLVRNNRRQLRIIQFLMKSLD